MRWDIVIAAAIVAVAVGVALYFLRSEKTAKEEKRAAAAGGVATQREHTICDVHRGTLARHRAELRSTPDHDPLRRGNIQGAINLEEAALEECERSANRSDLEDT